MATQVLKRSRAKFVSKQTVEQVGAFLQELPEKTPDTLSLRQTIEQLREPLEAALAKGYSYEELVPMLAQQGINIQPSTLKRYVLTRDDRPTGKRKTRQTRRKSNQAATNSVTPEDDESPAPDLDLTTSEDTIASEADAQASGTSSRKRGRAAAKASPEPMTTEPIETANEQPPSDTKQTRSRRTSTASSPTTRAKSRTTSTRGRKSARS